MLILQCVFKFSFVGLLLGALVSCVDFVDHVEPEPWELSEPDNESLCPELADWTSNGEYEWSSALSELYQADAYVQYFPLAFEGCGVYAVRSTLIDHGDEPKAIAMEVKTCNRCDRDTQLMWVGDPLGYFGGNEPRSWEGRSASGEDLKIDFGTSEQMQYRALGSRSYVMGPVTFISDVASGKILADSCHIQAFDVPPALFRVVVKPKDTMISYMSLHSGFWSSHTCQLPGRDRPEELETEISRGHLQFIWPRLQEMDVAFEWENAAYLPGAACEEKGIRQQMCITYTDSNWSHPFIEAERPMPIHRGNHFTQDVGVVEFPVPLGEIFYAD